MKKGIVFLMAALISMTAFSSYAASEPVNVALGKSYSIVTDVPDKKSYDKDIDTKLLLTDGKKSQSTSYKDSAWAKLYRAVGRTVTIDLEQSYAITGFNCTFLQHKGPGIYCPQYFEVSVSTDGKEFMSVATLENPAPNDEPKEVIAAYKKDFDGSYTARYVRFHFNVAVNCYADEFEVFGKAIDGSEKPFVKTPEKTFSNKYAPKDAIGAKDVMLLHCGYYPQNLAVVNNTAESLVPYVAYIDSIGRIVDTMFDSFIFTYVQGRAPSEILNKKETDPIIGVGPNTTRSFKSDWDYMLDSVFDPKYNVKALDEAAKQTKKALKLGDDFSIPVYITLPYPKVSDFVFGDYDGDGIDDKITSTDDCIKALKYFIDETLKRWNENEYDNLTLTGFYWMHEAIEYGAYEDELNLVKKTIDLCHSYDKQIISIPFYQASGIEFYNELGFDCSFMQPNLSFNEPLQRDPAGTMEDFAEACKKYGLAVEMEIHHGLVSMGRDIGKYYEQYMISCTNNGMMTDTPHAYYQGSAPGVIYSAAKSKDSYLRYIYDTTYKFIKQKLSFPDELKASSPDWQCKPNELVEGNIEINGDWFGPDVVVTVTKEPANGTVRVFQASKNFIFHPERDFVGTDSFEVTVTLGEKVDVLTVNIIVSDEDESALNSETDTSEQPKKPLASFVIPAIISGAALITAAITAVIIGKIKRKHK